MNSRKPVPVPVQRPERTIFGAPPTSKMRPLLPDCARLVLWRGTERMVPILPNTSSEWPRMQVDHVYVIHYTRNHARLHAQRQQLPQLGVGVSVVAAYDADEIDADVMRCMVPVAGRPFAHPWNLTTYYFDPDGKTRRDVTNVAGETHRRGLSCTLKLYVALYDMVVRNQYRTALVLEDDAIVRWRYYDHINRALSELGDHSAFTILFACSYSSVGWDKLSTAKGVYGLYTKTNDTRVVGLMPACAEVLSARGAAHILNSLPILGRIDHTLSDRYYSSGSQPQQFYVKRYPFIPAMEFTEKSETVGRRPLLR